MKGLHQVFAGLDGVGKGGLPGGAGLAVADGLVQGARAVVLVAGGERVGDFLIAPGQQFLLDRWRGDY